MSDLARYFTSRRHSTPNAEPVRIGFWAGKIIDEKKEVVGHILEPEAVETFFFGGKISKAETKEGFHCLTKSGSQQKYPILDFQEFVDTCMVLISVWSLASLHGFEGFMYFGIEYTGKDLTRLFEKYKLELFEIYQFHLREQGYSLSPNSG